ncbi:helix-turn-helix domain-containing protein [Streptomyces sp. NPDC093801]|uniref:helix-turn-helix domain-containing protein n=1 Tax=Streptomyces sp. NPDC093801 TaxID=3155203 RepID=UPI00344DF87C
MMQHLCVRCQTIPADIRIGSPAQPAKHLSFELVTCAAEQQVSATCSRRLRREHDFLAAVHFMVSARYHPWANSTTLTVARDIAARMHRSKDGHVAYGAAGIQRRLGVSRSTVMKHTRILRELGLLAFVEHGSRRRNALRTRLGDRFGPGCGFRRTATIYAPCAPAVWDRAQGRIRAGAGYTARIRALTPEGRARAISGARPTISSTRRPRTPSYTVVPHDGQPPLSGGSNKNSAASRAARDSRSPRGIRTKGTTGASPAEAAAGMVYAQQVRLHVWWAQDSCVRQLAYALRPLISAGFTFEETARELIRWNPRRRPDSVIGFVRSELRRRANTGLLHLPDGYVRPYRQVPVDETGTRHTRMLAERQERSRPAYERYVLTLAEDLRAALRARRGTTSHATTQPRWSLHWQEPEAHHLKSLPYQSSPERPVDVYRRRAWRRRQALPPTRPTTVREREVMAVLADRAAAVAAGTRLRAELDDWERAQRKPGSGSPR